MEKIIVYTQPDCKYSQLLVESLISENVPFVEKCISDPINRFQVKVLGGTAIPFSVVGADTYSGYDLNLMPRIREWQSKGGVMDLIKFINESTGKEVFRLNDEGDVQVDGVTVTDMKEITKAAEEANQEEE